jgi:hypothetical protein
MHFILPNTTRPMNIQQLTGNSSTYSNFYENPQIDLPSSSSLVTLLIFIHARVQVSDVLAFTVLLKLVNFVFQISFPPLFLLPIT